MINLSSLDNQNMKDKFETIERELFQDIMTLFNLRKIQQDKAIKDSLCVMITQKLHQFPVSIKLQSQDITLKQLMIAKINRIHKMLI